MAITRDFLGDRAAAWAGDLPTPEAWKWASTQSPPTYLVPIDREVGLTRHHVDELLAWVVALSA